MTSMPTIAILLSLASTNFGQASTDIMQQSHLEVIKPSKAKQMINDGLKLLAEVKGIISASVREINIVRSDAEEITDIEAVINNLSSVGYVSTPNSLAAAIVLDQGLSGALEQLNELIIAAEVKHYQLKEDIVIDKTDTYLGLTLPAQQAMAEVDKFGRDLYAIVAATWRNHQGKPSFVLNGAKQPAPQAEQKEAIVA